MIVQSGTHLLLSSPEDRSGSEPELRWDWSLELSSHELDTHRASSVTHNEAKWFNVFIQDVQFNNDQIPPLTRC